MNIFTAELSGIKFPNGNSGLFGCPAKRVNILEIRATTQTSAIPANIAIGNKANNPRFLAFGRVLTRRTMFLYVRLEPIIYKKYSLISV